MHRIAGRLVVIMGSLVLSACGEPTAPITVTGPRPALGVERGRWPGTGPISVPDSIGIPPSPVPPIYEEAPPNFDGGQ